LSSSLRFGSSKPIQSAKFAKFLNFFNTKIQ
jgi:hypothetical protein